MPQTGLDAAFLDFIRDEDPEARRRIHGHYVRFFEGRRGVVDLACGDGEFVGLLAEAGLDAVGVDADADNVATAVSAGRNVLHADVRQWLTAQPDDCWGGIFNAHLVEHLGWPDVLALYGECHRVLEPGGVLVTVTPNVRSLYSHLEMFYQHFGHVTFYHPRLLAFFAHRAGFAASREGENPHLAAPMFGAGLSARCPRAGAAPGHGEAAARPAAARGEPKPLPQLRYELDLPRRPGLLGGPWWSAKMWAVRLLVRPYLDPLVADLQRALAAADAENRRLERLVAEAIGAGAGARDALDDVVARLDRSFEVYVVSTKADTGAPSAQASGMGRPGVEGWPGGAMEQPSGKEQPGT